MLMPCGRSGEYAAQGRPSEYAGSSAEALSGGLAARETLRRRLERETAGDAA